MDQERLRQESKYTDAKAVAAAKTVKLDDFATPDDTTDLNVSTSVHGLVPKATNAGNYLKDDGTWAAVAGSTPSGTAQSETTFGIAVTAGVLTTYSRGDHTHGSPTDPVIAHTAAADPHTGYRLESADHSHQSAGAQAGQLDHGLALTGLTDDDHTQYLLATGARTLSGVNLIGENAGLKLDTLLSGTGQYCGIVQNVVAGTVLAFGDCVYLAAASTRWDKALASTATTSNGRLGICVVAASAAANTCDILTYGLVNASAFPTLTVGAPVFISAGTAGAVTPTVPSAASTIVRIIGYGDTAGELFFCPENDWLERV